jgi:hypothetical protein
MSVKRVVYTFNPLARLMARSGLNTLSTLRILMTEMAPELKVKHFEVRHTVKLAGSRFLPEENGNQ